MNVPTISLCAVLVMTAGASQAAPVKARTREAEPPVVADKMKESKSYKLPPSGVMLTQNDLVLFALQKLNFKKADSFSSDFDESPLIGRKFRLEFPVTEFELNGPSWIYDISNNRLTVRQRRSAWSAPDFIEPNYKRGAPDTAEKVGLPSGLQLWGSNEKFDEAMKQNVFGATVKVSQYSFNNVYIGGFRKTGGDMLWTYEGDDFYGFKHDFKLAPDEARKAVVGMTEVIEGTVIPTADNRAVICGSDYIEPTVSRPVEASGMNCVVSAQFDNVEIKSPALGEVPFN